MRERIGPAAFPSDMTEPRQSLGMVAGALLVLTGCQQHKSTPVPARGSGAALAPSAAAPALTPGSAPLSHPLAAATGVPAPEATEAAPAPVRGDPRSPDQVLRDWGVAIERRDWGAVRALWGHGGADSGVGARHFAAQWDRLHHPVVSVGQGAQEGAAGSLYYTAPVTIIDGARRITGTVTIRRANDAPGATPEQLRWHADATTRAPWTSLR